MSAIDPTALLARAERRKTDRDVMPDVENLIDELCEALVAAYVERERLHLENTRLLREELAAEEWEAEIKAERDTLRAEVERLRGWKDEASAVLLRWHQVYQAIGRPGRVGDSISDAVQAEVERLRTELDTSIARADDMHESMVRQVTALRAAVARMTGPEAVDAVQRVLHDQWCVAIGCTHVDPGYRDDAAAAVRAITALGAP